MRPNSGNAILASLMGVAILSIGLCALTRTLSSTLKNSKYVEAISEISRLSDNISLAIKTDCAGIFRTYNNESDSQNNLAYFSSRYRDGLSASVDSIYFQNAPLINSGNFLGGYRVGQIVIEKLSPPIAILGTLPQKTVYQAKLVVLAEARERALNTGNKRLEFLINLETQKDETNLERITTCSQVLRAPSSAEGLSKCKWTHFERKYNSATGSRWSKGTLSNENAYVDYRFAPYSSAHHEGDAFLDGVSQSTQGNDDIDENEKHLTYTLFCGTNQKAVIGSCSFDYGNIDATLRINSVQMRNGIESGWRCAWDSVKHLVGATSWETTVRSSIQCCD